MTLCIKYNNFDFNKLTLNKKKKFDNNAKIIYYPLNYNYDYSLNKKLYILTDWIEMDGFKYKYNKLTLNFINNNLDVLFNKIKNLIIINDNNTVKNQSIKMIGDNNDNDDNDMIDIDIDSESDIESESESENDEENKIVKKQYISQSIFQSIKKSNISQLNDNDKNIDYNNLIKLNQNLNDANLKSSLDDFLPQKKSKAFCSDINLDEIIKYELNFNDKSIIKLIPSKKSGLEEYELNKKDNYKEINRYFPTINKKNTNFKIVGKFLLYINVYCIPDFEKGIKIHIKSGELKYDKTFVENDILKSKGVYDDKIKIEI